MTRKTLYNIAAVLMLLFGAGHTTGVLSTHNLPPEALAVRAIMIEKHFSFMNTDSSYGAFYEGFGLCTTLFLLLASWLCFALGRLSGANAKAARPIAYGLFAAMIGNLALAYLYFFAGPVVFSVLVLALIAGAEWRS